MEDVRNGGQNDEPAADWRAWYLAREVKPRRIDPNPRCSDCKTGPMFHPQHRWEPCWVKLPGGDVCGCTVGLVSPPTDSG